MQGIFYALTAALLFGISTPLARLLVGTLHPLILAGLLYAGAGVGLMLTIVGRTASYTRLWPSRDSWLVFALAVLLGGVAGPILLMFGLQRESASAASLLLNLEAVFTALLAWWVFREHTSGRLVFGMACIVAGGLVLSWLPGQSFGFSAGAALIAAACLCWALDNNLMRKVSGGDAVALAGLKGLVAAAINFLLARFLKVPPPEFGPAVLAAFVVGFLGYGVSLSLFILALRQLGAARTGAYFSLAPFVGVLVAMVFLHESLTPALGIAALLMAGGLWLHLSEHHEHLHSHEALEHEHAHVHDEHHQHRHEFEWSGTGPHTHPHRHTHLTHRHPHFPDIHHAHAHPTGRQSG